MQPATPLDQPRAIGAAKVSAKLRDGQSHIDALRQSGALKLLFPRDRGAVEAVLVNTAGGITGGDRFRTEGRAGAGARLTLTTQAAERVYRAQNGQTGRVTTRLTAEAGAALHWLPQETILYDRSALQRRLEVDLASDAEFLMVEPVLFGRRAMGEELREARISDRVALRRGGVPLWRDGLDLAGDIASALDRPAIGNGARAMASLVFVSPRAAGALSRTRDILGTGGGASLLQADVLTARLLATDGYALRKMLVPVLDHLTQNTLPRSWRL